MEHYANLTCCMLPLFVLAFCLYKQGGNEGSTNAADTIRAMATATTPPAQRRSLLSLRSLLISINILLALIFFVTLITISNHIISSSSNKGHNDNDVHFNGGDQIITTTALENDLQKKLKR